MKKLLKKFAIPILAGILIAGIAIAEVGGGNIGVASFWKRTGDALLPVNSTWDIGSSTSRINKIWASDGDFSTLTFGAVTSGDIDMAGNDINNIGALTGNSNPINVGICTPTAAAGSGSLCVQSSIELGGGVFTKDNFGVSLGTGSDGVIGFSAADANAHSVYLGVPTGTATESSTVVVGETADITADLGFFDGETEPGIATLDKSGTRYADLRWDGSYFRFDTSNTGHQYLFNKPVNFGSTVVLGNNTTFQYGLGAGQYQLTSNGTTPRAYGSSAPLHIGSAGSSSSLTPTGNDLFVADELEVDGIGYFDNILKVLSGAIWGGVGKASGYTFSGTPSSRAAIIYDNDEGMSLVAGGTDNFGNHVVNLISGNNYLKDHDNDTLLTDPTLCLFSATDPDTDNQQKACMSHDTNDFTIAPYTGDVRLKGSEQKGQSTNIRTNTETITFAANPGNASIVTTSLIPDGAFLVGLTTRNVTSATNCTSIDIGDGTDVDMFGAGTGITAGTTTTNADATAQFGMSPAIGSKNVTITANGGNCFDGSWKVTAHYIDVTAATSN